MSRLTVALAFALLLAAPAFAQVRIKDITDVAGARGNQLIGVGLVVGLDGTGSRSTFTQEMAVNMMQRFGVTTQIFSPNPAEAIIRSTNISVVMVTAAASRPGSRSKARTRRRFRSTGPPALTTEGHQRVANRPLEMPPATTTSGA